MASVINSDHFRGKAAASQGTGGKGGGNMDDILRRLSVVESSVAVIRADVSAINAVLPHLATKSDLSAVEGSLAAKICSLEGSLTAKICSLEGSLTAKLNALETSIIKWIIGTVIASATLAFAIAKFVT
jgi:hypothetical protein